MKAASYITTSWDDGHPMDLHVADLLAKYGIAGTFYVPGTTDHGTMSVIEMRQLIRDFEIGAHTLCHLDLTRMTDEAAWREIADSKAWVEDNTDLPCICFCPPLGRYGGRHIQMIRKAGYLGVRSTELLSLDHPRNLSGLLLMPTTVQAFPHSFPAYAKNAIKRNAIGNLWRYVIHGRTTDWPVMARNLLREAIIQGGVFHLWGHSWELKDTSQWQRLTDVLRFMGDFSGHVPTLTNGQICRTFLSTAR